MGKIIFHIPIVSLAKSKPLWIAIWLIISLILKPLLLFSYSTDTTNVVWRKFDEKKIERFRNKKEFDYRDKEPTKAKETLNWFEKWINDLFDMNLGGNTNDTIYDIITILLIVGAFAALIWGLSGVQYRWLFTGKGIKASPEFTVEEENIHEISFNQEIASAEASGNFRKAIRLHYLQILKALADHSLITWEIQKTNHEYAKELRNTAYADDFSILTYWFDYVWYGEFNISKEMYAVIREKFEQFPIKPETTKSFKPLQHVEK
ncbi:MAG: DUF4129 domain-containing protein [Flavobacteriales bacterium]|nr:DUF4129 domain-containing protein [Flavobacteriales bacterium]